MATALTVSDRLPSYDVEPPALRPLRHLGPLVASLTILCMVAGGFTSSTDRRRYGDRSRPATGGCDGGGNAAGVGCGGGAVVGGGAAAKSCGSAGSKAALSGSKLAASSSAKLMTAGVAKVGAGVMAKGVASGLLVVEAGGARAFSTVGAHALAEGIDIGGLHGVLARYPEVAEHAGSAAWVAKFAESHPNFTEEVGKELYFGRPKDWASYGGERGLSGIGVRHSLSFSHYARAEAESRFGKVIEEVAMQLAQNGVDLLPDAIDNFADDDGVDVSVKDGMLNMKIETPEATYSVDPLPLRTVRATHASGGDPRAGMQVHVQARQLEKSAPPPPG